jgi:hypothetical protein
MKAAGHVRFHVALCSPDRHRRRRGGAPPWSHQYDARRLGQYIPEPHASSRAAAIYSDHRHHVDGLDHGEKIKRENTAIVATDSRNWVLLIG